MSTETPKSPQAEQERQAIVSRCNEAIGGTNPLLSEVLSYFPEQAELFIKTQNYAAEIEGERKVWFTIRHKNGHWENLGVRGYTGENLLNVIQDIQILRGEGSFGEGVGFLPEKLERILSAVDMNEGKMSV